jgi:hypothetical protein
MKNLKIISLQVIILASSIISLFQNNIRAQVDENRTARYMEGARLRCTTDLHRKIIIQAFQDIINLPSDTLNKIKYESDKPDEKKISLLDVFNRYITPNSPAKKIGPGFYDEVKSDEVKYKVKEILFAIKTDKSQNNKSSTSALSEKDRCIIRIKSLFDITIPETTENFTCFEETLFRRAVFVRFSLSASSDLNKFFTDNTKLLGNPFALNNPLKDMPVDVRIKNKWHPGLLREFSGGTNAIWKRDEKLTYHYVFGKHDKEELNTVYLVCISENR